MQRVQAPRHRSPLEEVTESTTIPEMINLVEQFPRLDTSEEATRDGILDELQKITQEEWGTMNGILATRVGEDGNVHQMGHSWSALMRYKLGRLLRERNEEALEELLKSLVDFNANKHAAITTLKAAHNEFLTRVRFLPDDASVVVLKSALLELGLTYFQALVWHGVDHRVVRGVGVLKGQLARSAPETKIEETVTSISNLCYTALKGTWEQICTRKQAHLAAAGLLQQHLKGNSPWSSPALAISPSFRSNRSSSR